MIFGLALLVSLLLGGSLAQAAPDTPDYAIQLVRSTTVGDRYRVVASGSDEQTVTASVDGQEMPPRNENLAVELVADCEVLAVTSSRHEAKARMVIVKLVRLSAGQPSELLPAGTVVVAERVGGKKV